MNHASNAKSITGCATSIPGSRDSTQSASEGHIAMLMGKANSLIDQIDHLADRLSFVLSPSAPSSENKIAAVAPPVTCELEGRLIDIDSTLRIAIARLEALTERVAI